MEVSFTNFLPSSRFKNLIAEVAQKSLVYITLKKSWKYFKYSFDEHSHKYIKYIRWIHYSKGLLRTDISIFYFIIKRINISNSNRYKRQLNINRKQYFAFSFIHFKTLYPTSALKCTNTNKQTNKHFTLNYGSNKLNYRSYNFNSSNDNERKKLKKSCSWCIVYFFFFEVYTLHKYYT